MTALAPALLSVIVVAAIGLILWGVIFLAGRLVRLNVSHSTGPNARKVRSRFFRDLEPLEGLLVDFVADSPEFAEVLGVLVAHDRPLSLAMIVHELRIGRSGSSRADTVPMVGVALCILHMAGLVELKRAGFVATSIGRELRQRMRRGSTSSSRALIAETNPQGAVNRPFSGLSVGKKPADNHGTSWRSSLRGLTPRRYQPPIINIGALREPSLAHLRRQSRLNGRRRVPTKVINKMNNENDIIITAPDHAELNSVIIFTGKVSQRVKWELRLLENELKRARIVAPDDLPPDVITMNSRAELLDLESGERMEFTLVLPADANINDGKISVLAPLGTAMLGYRVGDEFEWHVPYGLRRLKVIKLHFQPEASLKKAA
jgi:regulator of nucleoside diphosphate kinase